MSVKLLVDTLLEDIKLLLFEKQEFETQGKCIVLAFYQCSNLEEYYSRIKIHGSRSEFPSRRLEFLNKSLIKEMKPVLEV